MASISVVDGSLAFTPKANSYFYESFSCTQAKDQGYNAVSFSVIGPAGGAASLEIQTKSSCSASAYSSSFFAVSGLTGSKQTVTVPLNSFAGAKTNAITGLVWSSFSKTGVKWVLDDVQFVCSTPGQASTGNNCSDLFHASSFLWLMCISEFSRDEAYRGCYSHFDESHGHRCQSGSITFG